MVPPASDKISRVSPYSGSHFASSRFRLRGLHPLRPAFQCRSTSSCLALSWSFNPDPSIGLGSSPFARRYLRNHFCFLFLRLLRCFSSPGSLHGHSRDTFCKVGCPIRISAPITGICPLTQLFAAYRVLLRLREPRHPLCALVSFLYFLRFC